MFSSQISLLSSTYQTISSVSLSDIKPNSLESLIFNIIVYVSDNHSDIQIKSYLDAIKNNQNSWLLVANLLTRQITKQLGYGNGVLTKDKQQIPIDIKKQLSFHQRIQFPALINYENLIKKYSLQKLVPQNVSLYNIEYFLNPVFALYRKPYLTKQMSLEGQTWISTTPYPHVLLVLQEISTYLLNDQQFNQPYKYLLKARLSYLHNLILDKPVGSLIQGSINNYKKFLNVFIKDKSISSHHYVIIQMEYFNVLLFGYKYTEAEVVLQQCKRVLNMDIQFTGKLGRRTKFQQFDTVQLVMNVTQFKEKQKINTDDIPEEELNVIPASDLLQLPKKTQQQPSTINMEQDSILWQKPKLNQDQEVQNISVLKQLLILNITYYMYETTPKDQILFLKISSMLAPVLEAENIPYVIKFSLLALRSLNQIPRYKNSDRALQQLQQLVNDYNIVKDSDSEYALATPSNYRIHLTFVRVVAEKVMGFGLVMTGVQMYQKSGMYEQCVEGLISAGHKTKAIQLAKKLLSQQGNSPSPYLLCLMGDATSQIHYYQQSWKQSNSTYSRAQKTLGRIYFYKKQFEKCVQAYKKALNVNFYHPDSWFTLGCAYINLNQFADGGRAFSQSISIDDSQGQAWGNLASCFIGQKKINQAYGALAQALRYSENSIKLWQNMLGVSIKLKKFYKYMQCIQRLIVINASQLIDEDTLKKLTQILQYRITFLSVQRKRITGTYKTKIDSLYKIILQKMGQKEYVWRQYALYIKQSISYFQQLQKLYTEAHQNKTLVQHDIIQGYQILQNISQFVETKVQQLNQQLVDSKQKQLNMAMRLGWQSQIDQRNEVKIILQQYKKIYLEIVKQEDQDYKIFINSIEQKIKTAQEN